MATETIPVIDLGPYLAGEAGAMDRTAAELRFALTEIGFYFIVNHGIAREKIAGMFAEVKRFHAQPVEKKLELKLDQHNTGYLPMRGNTLRTSTVQTGTKANLNEAFFVKREMAPDHPDVLSGRRFRGLNRWPDLPGFRDTVVDYCNEMERLVQKMVRLYARALDLPANWFDTAFAEPMFSMRMTHYPPQDGPVDDEFGLAPHTDTSFLTLLAPNEVPGLSIRTQSGNWIDSAGNRQRLCRERRPDAAALHQRPVPGDAASRDQQERRRALCACPSSATAASTGRLPRYRPPWGLTSRRNTRRPGTPIT